MNDNSSSDKGFPSGPVMEMALANKVGGCGSKASIPTAAEGDDIDVWRDGSDK